MKKSPAAQSDKHTNNSLAASIKNAFKRPTGHASSNTNSIMHGLGKGLILQTMSAQVTVPSDSTSSFDDSTIGIATNNFTSGTTAVESTVTVSTINSTSTSSTVSSLSGATTGATSITTLSGSTSLSTLGSTGGISNASKTTSNAVCFPKNCERLDRLPMIATCQPFETTAQLVHHARLLRNLDHSANSSSLTLQLSQSVISDQDRQWMDKVESDTLEQARIRRLVVQVVNEFLVLPFKDPESIREIVLVAPVLDKSTYQALLRCLLQEFDKQGIMNKETLQGVIQVVEDAPPEVLEIDNLITILERIRNRLESTASQSPVLILHLTQAISRILSVMADMKVKDLDRVKTHSPVRTALAALKGDDNPYLRYQAIYALQALRFVPDDETPVECFARHAFKIGGSLVKLSSVMQMNFDGFADGLVEAKQSIMDIYGIAKDGLDDFMTLKEDGKMLIDDVLGSTTLNPWFVCLRGAEELARNGQFIKLSECINKVTMSSNQNFQWGVCQILGEIAADSSFDLTTRSCSVDYFGWIYSTTTHNSVKSWILTLLGYLSDLKTPNLSSATADEAIKSQAATVAQSLYKDEDKSSIFTNIFKKDSTKPFEFPYLLRRCLPFPLACSLLQKANKIPDVEPKLHTVRTRLKDNGPAVYVPLMCKVNFQASSTDNLKFLEETVTDFLASKKEVLLILGDSGAGKSTFNRYLEHKLWNEYKPGGSIPLFIDLKAMGRLDDVDMIQKTLDLLNFEDFEIRELKRSRQLILICDGYDECRQWTNLHKRMKLDLKWESLKVVITCRTQYLATMDDRSSFKPRQEPGSTMKPSDLYEESVIVPFQKDQIQNYIDLFRSTQEAQNAFGDDVIWTTEYFMNQLSSLMDLVKNPFMLHLALRILPEMAKDGRDLSTVQLTRFELYDEFTKRHFENEQNRLIDGWSRLDADESRAFKLIKNSFPLHCMGFSKRLASMVFMENDGVNAIEYSMSGEEQGWKDSFFGEEVDPKVSILRQSSQLNSYTMAESSRQNSFEAAKIMYQFPHRSILEFLYSCQLCDHWDSAVFFKYFETSHYNNLSACLSSSASASLLIDHPLNQRSIVSEPSILSFLVEHARKFSTFKEQLIAIVHRSKIDPKVSQAAANAITVLVQAGNRFNNQDLKGIRVPGADLSRGQFDGTQLQGADLTDCTLSKVWLRTADLSDSKMGNIRFGELPFIREESDAELCAYSKNGDMFAVGFSDFNIIVYDTLTWDELYTLKGHSSKITVLQFSPCGKQSVSTSDDGKVCFWDAKTGAPGPTIDGLTVALDKVAFSPNGEQIVLSSWDETMQLCNAQTGELGPILEGHAKEIASVAYSPTGQQIASGSRDGTVRLWDAKTGTPTLILKGHSESVTSVVFSPNGQQVASCSLDTTVRLWNSQSGAIDFVLQGHTDMTTSAIYSPSGQHVASVGDDETVRLWEVQTGLPGPILKGHTRSITCIAFSPNGQQIASSSRDCTARLWDVQSGTLISILEGHTHNVISVDFSPIGQHLATVGLEGVVRIWDADIGTLGVVLKSHTGEVTSVAYSSATKQIASMSDDGIIQLWDAQTGMPGPILKEHTLEVTNVIRSPSGRHVVSGSKNGTTRLLDAQTSAPILTLEGHTRALSHIVYSPGGQQLASGSDDGTVRLWDAQTGAPGHVMVGHSDQVADVVYSPCGDRIASSSCDGIVRLWDAQSGSSLFTFEGHTHAISNVAYSPTGQQIASSSYDGTVRLWGTKTGMSIVLEEHSLEVTCVVFSPDGQQVASGSWDWTVRLWDAQSGTPGHILEGHTRTVTSILYSPSGLQVVSGSEDRTVRVWNVNSGQCLNVVQFSATVNTIALDKDVDGTVLTVGCDDSVSVCQLVEGDGTSEIRLIWTTSQNSLNASKTKIGNVEGLSNMNKRLLLQRGAEVNGQHS